jgi:hypothetical protein
MPTSSNVEVVQSFSSEERRHSRKRENPGFRTNLDTRPEDAFYAAAIDFASTFMSTPPLIALLTPHLNIFEQPMGLKLSIKTRNQRLETRRVN